MILPAHACITSREFKDVSQLPVIIIWRRISRITIHNFNIGFSRFLLHRLSRLILPYQKDFVICPTVRSDVKLLINPNDAVGEYIYYFGEWEPNVVWAIESFVKEGDVFVDVGAYIGDMTCLASKLVGEHGRVYAIEPSQDNFDILCLNIRLNNLLNVYPIRVALSEKDTIGFMQVTSPTNRGGDTLSL